MTGLQYFYGIAAASFVVTSLVIATVRWFHMCRPYDRNPKYFYPGRKATTIIYLSALTSINPEYYEAAKVDGANRWKTIWHITIPSILPTYLVLLFLNMANFLSNGMEQFYVFQNSFNRDYIQVLDLYVYNVAYEGGSYPLATAIGILKSLVSIVLLCVMNGISKATRGENFI